ncbi:MAG TPA: hypothetical protein PLH07_05205 [Sulfurovum sp.]|jgi:hypothetical protein|nr:MAG: hypothetical protein B7Y23_03730 [Sulfurovum sp. 16-42-52]OZA46821.1 MAG: hypothetical protein B7X80_01120 [Sulfurovum sp. 17-42-90]OZA59140.1 MAG: hypothetical protein B7X69_09245 [Sulfurovum sp. 39-42-12]HQR74227.1 hypothetical protein [Sulfurovum sp.]HQS72394.1 hypothetical protein [Sulfurovum sp.]
MKTHYTTIVIFFLSTTFLFANTGTEQTHPQSSIPTPSATDVKTDITPTFVFDKVVLKESIGINTIQLGQLTPKKNKINGTTSVVDNTTLLFVPSEPLPKGTYDIKVKPIKLLNEKQSSLKSKSTAQKITAWLCGLAYDDISECPLYELVFDVPKTTTTKPIHYTFEVTQEATKVIALHADTTRIELSEYNTTQLHITATYEDNTNEDVTQKATYSSSNGSVDVTQGVVTSNDEGSAIVTVSYADKTIQVTVEVYEMIEGHLLPHEPQDPDATLLGVDANSNGVRDEVERWIYKEMTTYHHPEIERVIAMQDAKAYQMALVDPANTDDKVNIALTRAGDCWDHYRHSKDLPFDGAVEKYSNALRDALFNTRERLKTYMDYDATLGGKVFTLTPTYLLNTSYCDANIDVLP